MKMDKEQQMFIQFISHQYLLDASRIQEYEAIWDWSCLSNNQKINWGIRLLEKYEKKLDWLYLSENLALHWSPQLLNHFENRWNWGKVEMSEPYIDNTGDIVAPKARGLEGLMQNAEVKLAWLKVHPQRYSKLLNDIEEADRLTTDRYTGRPLALLIDGQHYQMYQHLEKAPWSKIEGLLNQILGN